MTPDEINSNYPRCDKVYTGRTIEKRGFLGIHGHTAVPSDVRSFIRTNDVRLRQTLATMGITPRDPAIPAASQMADSDILQIVQRWVIDHITYTDDKASWGTPEFWQLTDETLTLKTGDCEDGAILIASLILTAGVDPWRVRVAAGWVQAGPGAQRGGHAYVTYCDGSRWYPVDWCYYAEVASLDKRRTFAERPEYQDVWFSFNHEFCWDPTQTTTFAGRARNRKESNL